MSSHVPLGNEEWPGFYDINDVIISYINMFFHKLKHWKMVKIIQDDFLQLNIKTVLVILMF